MRYKVIAIYHNKWRIYDIVNDLVYPRNFNSKNNAERFILTSLGTKTVKFHRIKTVLDF
jgi:hypothetical protein